MSVEIRIEYKDGRKTQVTSIIPQYVWNTVADKLGLQWIPFFPSGLVVEDDAIPDILDELAKMKDYLSDDKNFRVPFFSIPKKHRDATIKSIDYVVEGLNEVRDDPNAEAYIG